MTTPIRTVERDGATIAYQVTGRGPLDLLVVHDFAGHLELDWALPGAARLFERLGSFARVIRFDKRGTGLSSRDAVVAGVEADAADALAVLDAAGSAQAAVFAWGDGAAPALVLAARRPERVAALAVFGGSARPSQGLGEAMAAAERAHEAWGERLPPGFAPDADDTLRRWWTVRARASANPAAAGALVLTEAQADVRDEAALVAAPTLVLHRAGDTAILPAAGKELAGLVPTGRYAELPGAAHLPYIDPDELADELETFFTGSRPDREMGRETGREAGLAGYELERELGRGGMGTVHLARDTRLGRQVALKLLPPELAHDESYRDRFLREQRVAASIEHPNVVPIYDAGESEGRLYLVMRYIAGTDLKHLIETGPLDPVRAVRIVEQVAEALDAAHERGLVHRDVKPANVLLDGASRAYLCDFGLTKETASGPGVTATGQLVGTLDYLAPEQIRGAESDGRADVYALGCVLYECVTGRAPFAGRAEAQTLWGHMQEEPVAPSTLRAGVPPELDAVVLRALAKEPQDRYATAGQLAGAARAALGLDAPAVLRRRRRWGRAALLVGAALVIVAAAIVAYEVTRSTGAIATPPNSVAVIDARTNRLLADIGGVAEEPTSVAWNGDTVWVTSAANQTLVRIDARDRRVVRTIGVGTDAAGVAFTPGSVWVASATDAILVRVDAEHDVARERIDLRPRPDAVGVQGYAIAAGYGRVWVAAGSFLAELAPQSGEVLRRVPLNQVTLVAVGQGAVWAGDLSGVVRLDPRTARRTGAMHSDAAGPLAVGAGAVWVASGFTGGGIVKIDHRSLSPSRILQSPATAAVVISLVVADGAVWAGTSDGQLIRFDPQTGAVVARLRLAGRPSAIAIGGGRVWVALQEFR